MTFVATNTPNFDDALCRTYDNNIWFDHTQTDRAIKICQQCPIINQCLQYAKTLPVDTVGVFAGHTTQQLKKLRQTTVIKPIKHGTQTGYSQHRNRNEEPCHDCKTAHATYQLERKQKQAIKFAANGGPTINHGTHSGYVQHQYHGIPLCEPCRQARNEYNKQLYHRRHKQNRI